MQYLKKTHFSPRMQFETKKYDLFEKNAKKSNFETFFFKNFPTSCLRLQIFQICETKLQNWVALYFGKVLKIKVTKGELIISNHLEMADQYLLGGSRSPSSHWLGLKHENFYKHLIHSFLFLQSTIWLYRIVIVMNPDWKTLDVQSAVKKKIVISYVDHFHLKWKMNSGKSFFIL